METTTKNTAGASAAVKSSPGAVEVGVRIFAIFGIVIVLLIALYGAFAVIRSVPNVWNSLGNAFSSVTSKFERSAENLSISASKNNVPSGEEVSLYWNLPSGLKQGSYAFTYDCVDGVNFEVVSSIDNSKRFAFCNTETSFVNQNNTLKLVPTLVNKEVSAVPIYIYFTENGNDKINAFGRIDMTVVRSSSGSNTGSTGTSTNTNATNTGGYVYNGNYYAYGQPLYVTVPTGTNYNLYGRPDLSVRVLDTGIINRNTNQYAATSYVSKYDRVAVRFEIENRGTNVSGIWSFNVSLPTVPFYIYPGTNQPSLNPGDKIQYTIAFDNIQARQENQVVITADPYNGVAESNEANNIVIQNITLSVY